MTAGRLELVDLEALGALTLHRLKVSARAEVSAAATRAAKLDVAKDAAGALTFKLSTCLLGHHVGEHVVRDEQVVRWQQPATPWQHWKDNRVAAAAGRGRVRRWMAAPLMWWLERRPPRLVGYAQAVKFAARVDQYHTFPVAWLYPSELGESQPRVVVTILDGANR